MKTTIQKAVNDIITASGSANLTDVLDYLGLPVIYGKLPREVKGLLILERETPKKIIINTDIQNDKAKRNIAIAKQIGNAVLHRTLDPSRSIAQEHQAADEFAVLLLEKL